MIGYNKFQQTGKLDPKGKTFLPLRLGHFFIIIIIIIILTIKAIVIIMIT